jgi:calcineurin-like phosphoesterase family protein
VCLSEPGRLNRRIATLFALFLLFAPPVLTAPARNSPPEVRPTLDFPRFEPGQPLHLVVYGDTRFTNPSVTGVTNPRVRRWLAEQIGRQKPQAILLTGDTPFHGADPADWEEFQRETESWRKAGALQLPATGNHEGLGGPGGIPNYLKNFPDIAGHRYYSALLGGVEIISLDYTQPSGASTGQGRWFAAQLDHIPKQVEFLLILYHIPWMADRQSEVFAGLPTKDALALRQMLEGRLGRIRPKVVVFNGHIHNYERFERRGVEYVVTGGGGAVPYPVLLRGGGDLYRDTAFPVYHYLVLDVADHKLHGEMWKVKDPDANTLEVEAKDEFTVDATAAGAKLAPQRKVKTHEPPD